MDKLDNRNLTRLLKTATHLGALIPLAWLIYGWQQNLLGVDPIREVTLRTGKTTLILLWLTLSVSPLILVFGWSKLLPVRRLLGLYSFFYVSLHLLSFIGLDYFFQWAFIIEGIFEQRYVLVGFAAFLLMLPLALTSNRRSMRRLGKRWKQLHRLTYLVSILGIIHFLWLVKNVYTQPIIYGLILALLLLTRIKAVKTRISYRRRGSRRAGGNSLASTD